MSNCSTGDFVGQPRFDLLSDVDSIHNLVPRTFVRELIDNVAKRFFD
jgi:hypothetical protein